MKQEEQPTPREVFSMEDNGLIVDEFYSDLDPLLPPSCDMCLSDSYFNVTSDNATGSKLIDLSMEERNRAINDLHGVPDTQDETPDMLHKKLREIDQVAASFGDNAAYLSALEMNKKYVERIKLLCLRADHYHCEKASARLVSFFSFKQALFGEDKLTRDIVVDDFQGEDKVALENGLCQLLKEKDRAGRAVLLASGKRSSDVSVETMCRVLYYGFMAAVRDEETQKKGVIFIYDLIGQEKFHSDRPSKISTLFWLLPVRVAAHHACYDNHVLDVGIRLLADSMDGQMLCRFRTHYGSYLECSYSLMAYGIPRNILPLATGSGDIDMKPHRAWLDNMKKNEKTPANNCARFSVGARGVPGPMDIVMGRGRHAKTSIGFLRFRDLVEKYRGKYDDSERYEKIVIANVVLQELRRIGCRFVRSTAQGLVEQPEDVAIEKISHAFRNIRLVKGAKKGREAIKSARRVSVV